MCRYIRLIILHAKTKMHTVNSYAAKGQTLKANHLSKLTEHYQMQEPRPKNSAFNGDTGRDGNLIALKKTGRQLKLFPSKILGSGTGIGT